MTGDGLAFCLWERRRRGWTLERLAAWVCAELEADLTQVRSGGRRRPESRARAVLGYLATRELGHSLLEVSRRTGVTAGPMSRSVQRGEAVAKRLGIALPAAPPRGVDPSRDAGKKEKATPSSPASVSSGGG